MLNNREPNKTRHHYFRLPKGRGSASAYNNQLKATINILLMDHTVYYQPITFISISSYTNH